MICNYHTHTARCNHADGTDIEYIENAIEKNINTIAFTEHMPDRIQGDEYRLSFQGLEEYLNTFQKYKEEYKDKIEILVGLECEYYREDIEFYKSLKNDERVDMLILGHHFAPDRLHYNNNITTKEEIDVYVEKIKEGMKSGFFSFLAHPDLFMTSYGHWDEYCEKAAYDICSLAKELNLPLEINAQGIRTTLNIREKGNEWLTPNYDRYYYPVKEFWEVSKSFNNRILINGDYHSPKAIEDEAMTLARNFAKELNINVVYKL